MKITIKKAESPVSIAILCLEGKLDGSNYESLIKEAQQVYMGGVRDILLDLGKLTFISSAGLAAFHQVALLFRGEALADQDEGWAAYHAISRALGGGKQEHVKLLSPSQLVQDVLDITGFDTLFDIYTDLDQAIASFHLPVGALAKQIS